MSISMMQSQLNNKLEDEGAIIRMELCEYTHQSSYKWSTLVPKHIAFRTNHSGIEFGELLDL